MKITKRQLRRIIREEQADVTPKYDKDSALVGDQSKLKDPLQKAIIDKTVEDREEAKEKEAKEKSESIRITKTQLRRIIKEEKRRLNELGGLPGKLGAHSDAAVEKAKSVIEQQLNSLYHDQMLENADLIAILEQMIKDINSGFVGEPT